jgi:VWFA-related protein
MRPLIVAALVVLLAPVPAPARADEAAATTVPLDVVVKDKKGAPIPDLRPDEVEVYENGDRRPFDGLRFVRPGGPATERTADPGQLVALVFDGLDQNQQKRAQRAVEELLAHDLGANTFFAVFRIGLQLWTVQSFTNDHALVTAAVEKAASPQDAALAEPDAEARKEAAAALARLAKGRTDDPAALSRAEVLARIIRQGDRLLRQQQYGSPLYLLMAVAKGQATAPGRKTALYFTGGLTVRSELDDVFKTLISDANRAHVSFYAIDVGGLETWSETQSARDAIQEVARTSREQAQQTSGATTVEQMTLMDRTVDSTRGNWKQPLRELSETTGGFAVVDVNDYKKPMERLASDLEGYYEIEYSPASAAWDGSVRKIEIKVSRGGAKVQGPNGYIATPPDAAGPILAYERPLLEALQAKELRQDFPMTAGAFRFGTTDEGREITLIAEAPLASLKFTTDPKTKLYKLHFALLAVVKDAQGQVVERVSQDYPLEGPLDKLPQLQQGNVVFRRKVVVPPGRYTVELVARDRDGGATSVLRTPLEVPPSQALGLSSVVIVRRMEPAPPAPAGAPEDPLRGEAMRIVPSLDDPISKASTPKLPVYLIVYPAAGGETPRMTLEFTSGGETEGRSPVVLPAPDPDGRIRFLAPIPLDRFAPGRHEIKVTVRQGTEEAEERVAFTLQP